MGTPPPTTLTMPDLGAAYVGQEVWLTVVQTELYCPVRSVILAFSGIQGS